jgi:ribosome biogenesis GTPase
MTRKGKAQRRVKDWNSRFRKEAPGEFDTPEWETLLPQRVKIPAWRDAAQQAEAAGQRTVGMVMGLFPGGVFVQTSQGRLQCGLAGTFRPPKGSSALVVGDEVALALALDYSGDPDIHKQRADGFILSRQPRRTLLSRPTPISGKLRDQYDRENFEKVVAANMDVLLIVASARQPAVPAALIDRFCVIAERGEMKPAIVYNKIDLAQPEADLVAELTAGGLPLFFCSAKTGQGLSELLDWAKDKRIVLAGPSGVGKSSLINALVPGAQVTVGEIRMKDQRGRHVTSTVTVYQLAGGGVLVDTPGVRELALGISQAELPAFFPEIAALAGQCRFNNCSHTHEPVCAVRAAVESGGISPRRYESYLRMFDTIE